MQKIINRIHRVQGQLGALETSLERNTPCTEVVPQLLAVKGAVTALTQEYLEQALEECVEHTDIEQMKSIIKTLVRS